MRYVFDHDLHIHSQLSLCSGDPEQSPERILAYAKENHLTTVCLTDHFWEAVVEKVRPFGFYDAQDYAHIGKALPLPQEEGIRFLFGCETDMDSLCHIGIRKEDFEKFDFVIVPTTHLHMNGFTCRGDEDPDERAALYVKRFDALLDADLPFHKVGFAHLTCDLIYRGRKVTDVIGRIPDAELGRLFARAKACGMGIELNFNSFAIADEDMNAYLRPYRIAKETGCLFYFGSDAHHPGELMKEKANAEHIIDLLDLKETDKFRI